MRSMRKKTLDWLILFWEKESKELGLEEMLGLSERVRVVMEDWQTVSEMFVRL